MNLLQITVSPVWRGHEQKIIYLYEAFEDNPGIDNQYIIYNKYLGSITLTTTTLVLRAILHEVYLSIMNSGSSSKEIKYSYQIFSKSGLGWYFTFLS